MSETFRLLGIKFHWYGLIIGLAILLGWRVAEWGIGRLYPGSRENELGRSFWWVVLGGVVGARIYHVVDYGDYYLDHFDEVWQIWHGGLGIYGAIVGGLVGLGIWSWISARENWKRQFGKILDSLALGLPVAQAIGRIGNYINKEVYGMPTDLPWKVFIPVEKREVGYEGMAYYHPLFWYEAVWCLMGFLGLWLLVRKRVLQAGKGNYFALYLAWYAIGRMGLEYLRIRRWEWGEMPVATLIGMVIIGGVWGFYLVRKRSDEWTILDH